jgi:hypothetical protein
MTSRQAPPTPKPGATKGEGKDEGWGWLYNARKWHYFRDRRSLCGRWLGLGLGELQQGNDNSPDNCPTCAKKLLKEKSKVKPA